MCVMHVYICVYAYMYIYCMNFKLEKRDSTPISPIISLRYDSLDLFFQWIQCWLFLYTSNFPTEKNLVT